MNKKCEQKINKNCEKKNEQKMCKKKMNKKKNKSIPHNQNAYQGKEELLHQQQYDWVLRGNPSQDLYSKAFQKYHTL